MKKVNYKVIGTLVVVMGVSTMFYQFTTDNTASPDVKNHVFLPMNMEFANEHVPIELIDVKERLDREMTVNINLHSSTSLIIKRASRYFPIIEPILKRNGIPDDFKYLCVIESSLTNATSPAGARGFWQFMPATAKEYNLEVSDSVDERLHLEKATEAACVYLKNAYSKFGSWTMAAAAYNRGIAGIERQVLAQGVNDYYDMFLNQETTRYVFRILALKEIMNHPDKYGYVFPKEALYRPIKTKTVTIDSPIEDLQKWALNQGFNYKILKLHNPWLVDTSLKISGNKKYDIEIPVEGYTRR